MKPRKSLILVLGALLLPSLAIAAPASGGQPRPDPAAARLFADFAPEAPSCNGTAAPDLLFRSSLPCGACSNVACAGKSVGDHCGVGLEHCFAGISCQQGQVTCICKT